MASSSLNLTLRPLFHPHRTRFLISRQNPPETTTRTWLVNNSHVNCVAGLSFLVHSSYHSLHSSLSLRSRSILPYPSLCSLFQPRLPYFRSPLTSMPDSHQASSDPPSQSPATKTVRVLIKGRVQGVFYRNWTVENATQLGLKGWVRNRRDGSVEALFSGHPDKVQEMEQRCRRGPPAAMVTGLQVFPCNDDPGNGFECKSTV